MRGDVFVGKGWIVLFGSCGTEKELADKAKDIHED